MLAPSGRNVDIALLTELDSLLLYITINIALLTELTSQSRFPDSLDSLDLLDSLDSLDFLDL